MWRLLWLRRKNYDVWMPSRYLMELIMDCPFPFTVYKKHKDLFGKVMVRVRFMARPNTVYGYMHKKNWVFMTQDGMGFEIVKTK